MTRDIKNKPKFLNGHVYEYDKKFNLVKKKFELPIFTIDGIKLDIRNKDVLYQFFRKYKGNDKKDKIIKYGSEYCSLDKKSYKDVIEKKYNKVKLSNKQSSTLNNKNNKNNNKNNKNNKNATTINSNKLYFIRHEHSCANQLEKILGQKFKYKIGFPWVKKGFYQDKRGEYAPDPHLSFFGVKHGLFLSSFVNQMFNDKIINIYCSQLVRTAETAITLFSYKSEITLHVIPYISEKRTWTGKDKDNEPINMEGYINKVNIFYKKFKENNNIYISKVKLIFYNNHYKKHNECSIPYNNYSSSNNLEFIKKPNKQKFKDLFAENFINKSNNIIITHSKFLQGLDSNYKKIGGFTNNKDNHTIYTGKQGGQYIIKNNRKVYLSSTQ